MSRHDAHPGLPVTGLDGALYGRGAAPARQQRGVNVQAAQGKKLQTPSGQDEAVSDHHHQFDPVLAKRFKRGFGLLSFLCMNAIQSQAFGLQDRQVMGQGQGFDTGGLELEATTSGAIGLGEDGDDLMACQQQGLKRLSSKFGCSGKSDAHGGRDSVRDGGPGWTGRCASAQAVWADGHRITQGANQARVFCRCALTNLALILERFKKDKYSTNTRPIKWSISCWIQTACKSVACNAWRCPWRSR